MFQDRLRAVLAPAVQTAFQTLFQAAPDAQSIGFQPTRPEFEGDVTINVFPFLKLSGKGPEQTAQAIGEHLAKQVAEVERFNVVKGFLNIVIGDAYWTGFLEDAVEKDIL
nr:arginine--tRNA ligase [Flavobacteriales bacterium]